MSYTSAPPRRDLYEIQTEQPVAAEIQESAAEETK